MKKLLALIITFHSLNAFAQMGSDAPAQQITLAQWNEEAKTNIRLLPEYGHQRKSAEQKTADKEFVDEMIKVDTTSWKASNHMIQLGFNYLYHDIKKAMYRFNQAYLLDSTNTDIYWGFGGVYMVLGDLDNAKKQYLQGLAINPTNTHLLTDYATYFYAQYFALQSLSPEAAGKNLDSAIIFLNKSYQLDPKDPNTTFKLSTCYLYKKNCDNAWKFYNECKAVGGQPISDEYTKALMEACKQGK